MTQQAKEVEAILGELLQGSEHGALVQRAVRDYPEELAMQILTAAMRQSLVSPSEAFSIVCDCELELKPTLMALAGLCSRRGWLARELVLEALGVQVA